ncbi:MAG: lipoyl(octanoyl) transferase LipB [Desulfobacterales bacterium]
MIFDDSEAGRGQADFIDVPIMAYRRAQVLQGRCAAARIDGRLGRDVLMLLEHPPVFTLGRHGGLENLTVSEGHLTEKGIDVVQSERGGNITYHGPGQLVGYPIMDLEARRLSVKDYVKALETVLIETAAGQNVQAERNPKNAGAWVGNTKLGSIGICLRRGVAFHGIALNVNNDLTPFSWVNPCGLRGVSMTSIRKETGAPADMESVRKTLKSVFSKVFNTRLSPMSITELEARLDQPRKERLDRRSP